MNDAPQTSIAFTDDYSRVRLHPAALDGVLKKVLRALQMRAIRAAAAAGSLVVSSEDLEGPVLAAGYRFRPYGSVLIQGTSEASAQELFPLFDEIHRQMRNSSAFRSSCGVSVADVLLFRHFISFALEFVLKPARALVSFLSRATPPFISVSSAGSLIERQVSGAASSLGIETKVAPAGLGLRFAAKAKSWLSARAPLGNPDSVEAQWAASPLAASPGHHDIVLLCEEERRFNRALELMEHFRGLGKTCLLLCVPFKEEARKRALELQRNGTNLAFLPQFLPAAERVRVRAEALADAPKAWAAIEASPIVRGFEYIGVPFWSTFGDRLRLGWDSLSLAGAYSIAAADACLRAVSPSQVLFVDNGLYSKAMQETAKAQRRRTLWYADNPNVCTIRFWPEVMRRYFPADAVIASSEFIRASVASRFGYDPESVVVIGAPASEVAPVRKPVGFRREKPVVLALSTYVALDVSAGTRERFHRLVAGATRAAGCDLVVRAHPNESFAGLRDDLARWGIRPIFLSQKENIQDVLAECDLACLIFSQAGLEVLRAEKPLFVVQEDVVRDAYESIVPYVSSGAATKVDPVAATEDILAEEFRRCLAEPRERISRGREFFRSYSTAVLDPAEVARLGKLL